MANVLPRLTGALLVGGLFLGTAWTADAQTGKSDTKSPGKDSSQFTPTVSVDDAVRNINDLIASKWKDEKGAVVYQPAERCSDYEFIRRASLDIIGRIATVEEIAKFRKDPESQRRRMLVDRLLASEEYAKNWSTIWNHWLMTRTGDPLYREQMKLWLEEEMFGKDTMSLKDMAEKLISATGKTNDNGAVNYILAHLGGPTVTQGNQNPPLTLQKEGMFDMVPVTSRTVRLFLGFQIQCTQCHDHPFNADWKQKNFWGLNAFFRQTERIGTPANMMNNPNMAMRQPLTLTENTGFNKAGVIYYEKRNGVFLPTEAVFLDGQKAASNVSRREQLAKFITGHKNFSKAYVNRMWGHFFSRGVNEKPASDDFGEHNPIVQEELLDKVGEMLAGPGGDYNPKALIRWMTLSDAYQLKATANKTNEKAEDEVYFSRQMLKAMSPEQMLESLIVSTRPQVGKEDADLKKFRQDWMNRLVVNFGDDEGNEQNFNGTVVQALMMMNSREINQAISAESGTVQAAKKLKTSKEIMNHLFLSTLNRPCTEAEFTKLMANIKLKYNIQENDMTPALQDIFWALLNCNEFILNH